MSLNKTTKFLSFLLKLRKIETKHDKFKVLDMSC